MVGRVTKASPGTDADIGVPTTKDAKNGAKDIEFYLNLDRIFVYRVWRIGRKYCPESKRP
jgi:hypothetical protein